VLHCTLCSHTHNSNTADATVKADKVGKATAGTYDSLLDNLERAGQLRKIKREAAYGLKQNVYKKAQIGQTPQLHNRVITLVLCNDAADEEVSSVSNSTNNTGAVIMRSIALCSAVCRSCSMHDSSFIVLDCKAMYALRSIVDFATACCKESHTLVAQ
jgi:hypothetical protein